MSKRISLAQQLAQLEQPAPVDFDPEDTFITNNHVENADEEQNNAGREHYLDVGPSALRSKLHESLTDLKYEGVRISREQLVQNDKDVLDDTSNDAHPQPVTTDEEAENSDEELDENSDEAHPREDPRELPSKVVTNSKPAPQQVQDEDLSSTLKRTREEERKKGKAVAGQLTLFDGLLDSRIRLQKCSMSMNRLPNSVNLPTYLTDAESHEAVNNFLSESLGLANDLFDLQEKMMTMNEGLNVPARRSRRIHHDTQTNPDWEEELQESSRYFSELEVAFHPHLLTTLQKWSNKVLAIAPSALLPSNRTKFSSKSGNQVKSAVQLVDEALLERDKLIARTRTWRGTGNRLDFTTESSSANPEETLDSSNEDIFDDTDFYQSLLRDVIDARSGSGGAETGLSGISADWRATQKARKKARQKAIDTRASKGRKLRFEAHEKLQHFMAPAPPPGAVVWHEEQIDELFASLLGKGFADTDVVQEENCTRMDIDVGEALKGGFRVFG